MYSAAAIVSFIMNNAGSKTCFQQYFTTAVPLRYSCITSPHWLNHISNVYSNHNTLFYNTCYWSSKIQQLRFHLFSICALHSKQLHDFHQGPKLFNQWLSLSWTPCANTKYFRLHIYFRVYHNQLLNTMSSIWKK
jgi:hypothetical protein